MLVVPEWVPTIVGREGCLNRGLPPPMRLVIPKEGQVLTRRALAAYGGKVGWRSYYIDDAPYFGSDHVSFVLVHH